MIKEELINFLEQKGYHSYPIPRFEDESIIWTGSKRLPEGSSKCDTNEHKISYHIKIYNFKLHERCYSGLDVEIVANKHDQWIILKSYGISWEKVEKQLSIVEQCLLNAWEAIVKTKD